MATSKKRATKGEGSKSRKQRRMTAPRVYREPKTAAENGIVCAVCGSPAEYFDYERVKPDDSRPAFICSNEPRSAHSEKLLVKPQPHSNGRVGGIEV